MPHDIMTTIPKGEGAPLWALVAILLICGTIVILILRALCQYPTDTEDLEEHLDQLERSLEDGDPLKAMAVATAIIETHRDLVEKSPRFLELFSQVRESLPPEQVPILMRTRERSHLG